MRRAPTALLALAATWALAGPACSIADSLWGTARGEALEELGWGVRPAGADEARLRAAACMRGACSEYATRLQQYVFGRWRLSSGVAAGRVQIDFALDPAGSVTYLRVLDAGSPELARGCVAALRELRLGPPPPELVGASLIANFDLRDDQR